MASKPRPRLKDIFGARRSQPSSQLKSPSTHAVVQPAFRYTNDEFRVNLDVNDKGNESEHFPKFGNYQPKALTLMDKDVLPGPEGNKESHAVINLKSNAKVGHDLRKIHVVAGASDGHKRRSHLRSPKRSAPPPPLHFVQPEPQKQQPGNSNVMLIGDKDELITIEPLGTHDDTINKVMQDKYIPGVDSLSKTDSNNKEQKPAGSSNIKERKPSGNHINANIKGRKPSGSQENAIKERTHSGKHENVKSEEQIPSRTHDSAHIKERKQSGNHDNANIRDRKPSGSHDNETIKEGTPSELPFIPEPDKPKTKSLPHPELPFIPEPDYDVENNPDYETEEDEKIVDFGEDVPKTQNKQFDRKPFKVYKEYLGEDYSKYLSDDEDGQDTATGQYKQNQQRSSSKTRHSKYKKQQDKENNNVIVKKNSKNASGKNTLTNTLRRLWKSNKEDSVMSRHSIHQFSYHETKIGNVESERSSQTLPKASHHQNHRTEEKIESDRYGTYEAFLQARHLPGKVSDNDSGIETGDDRTSRRNGSKYLQQSFGAGQNRTSSNVWKKLTQRRRSRSAGREEVNENTDTL